MEVLVTICARGGSKGVPRKNIREVGGKPLIGHAIEDAKNWKRDCDIIISSDDEEIRETGRNYGAEVLFKRPEELATDESGKLPVIKHALKETEKAKSKEYDIVIDLDATAPLRKPEDIERAFQKLTETDAQNVYSVYESDKNPYFNMVELDEEGYAQLSKNPSDKVLRRQETPKVYAMNAAVYVYEKDFLQSTDSIHGEKTKIIEMPEERSVDIDTPKDLKFAKFLMGEKE